MRDEDEFDYTRMAIQVNFGFLLTWALGAALFGSDAVGTYVLVTGWFLWFFLREGRRAGVRWIWDRRR